MIDEAPFNLPPSEIEERLSTLKMLEQWLHVPMIVLSVVWLVLVTVELVWGESRLLELFGTIIWIIFITEFALRLALAPDRFVFLRANWISIVALVAPAFRLLRLFRILRFARAARGLRLVRIVGTANRSMNALRASLGRRRLGFVLAFTLIVTALGAGGMLVFEPAGKLDGGFTSYGDALWWTGMLLTSLGSNYWPKTLEGRVLCLLLSLYGFAVFGYITASFASFFVGRDAAATDGELAGLADIQKLQNEIGHLRSELAAGFGVASTRV